MKDKDMKKTTHLPLFGVGPIIVFGQIIFTAISIGSMFILNLEFARIHILRIPFLILGVALIALGIYFDLSAKYKSKIFKNVEENKLITNGVYAMTRNPVYSGAFLMCCGAVLIANNLLLLFVPIICWIYMTVFLKLTEEKWLKELYGEQYDDYCRRVNRCIPWFERK